MSKKSVAENKNNLRIAAERLASCNLDLDAGVNSIQVHLSAIFGVPSFQLRDGEYTVYFGVRAARVALKSPSFERAPDVFAAILPPEIYRQTQERTMKMNAGANVKGKLGLRARLFAAVFNVEASAGAEAKAGHEETQQMAEKESFPLKLVTPSVDGWTIGSRENGDPRSRGAGLPAFMEGCLHGEYFTSHHGEKGEGPQNSKKKLLACNLLPVQGGNDPGVSASISSDVNDLRVAIIHNTNPERSVSKPDDEKIVKLKAALVNIYIEKQAGESSDTGRLSSEVVLARSKERYAPKLSSPASGTVEKSAKR